MNVKLSENKFPSLTKLMAGYLNMDAYEITGYSDLKGMVEYYTTRVSQKSMKNLLSEIETFEQQSKDLDAEFEEMFDYGLNVEYIAGNVSNFFKVIKENVGEKIKEKKV